MLAMLVFPKNAQKNACTIEKGLVQTNYVCIIYNLPVLIAY